MKRGIFLFTCIRHCYLLHSLHCCFFTCLGEVPRILGDVLAVIGHALQAQEHFDKDGARLGLARTGVVPFLVPLPGFPDQSVDPVFTGEKSS